MKKLYTLLILLLFVTGCGDKLDIGKYEGVMKGYGTTYYNDYVKGKVSPIPDRFEVSIGKLREANERAEAKYDLGKVSRCNNESKVILTLDDEGKITGYTYSLECE